jgi:hypothetical protein
VHLPPSSVEYRRSNPGPSLKTVHQIRSQEEIRRRMCRRVRRQDGRKVRQKSRLG